MLPPARCAILNRPPACNTLRHARCMFGFALFALLAGVAPIRAETASFTNNVMAVLSKAGCNQGACHGNQNGKNGFKLSLRGEDPGFDLAALTRDTFGRRTNALQPA